MKYHYRNFLRERRDRLTQDDIIQKSQIITDTLVESDMFKNCGSLFAYLGVRNEVQTYPLIDYCFRIGKPVYVPVTRDKEMFFTRLFDFSHLKEAAFGIPEPENPVPANPDRQSLFVIPGVGFDKCGNRIGYGAGFYDRYLSRRASLHLVGICFEIQLVDLLPAEETDIRMDSVLTEKRWIVGKNC
ncbi:MAG: 5-formyltetrahydrofolate cyclo-ligase [Methanimicrococcus sp.]|nr:5-formyltetrahydrofolate cyclo-ligase [Methanimicrococcus sp.]